MATIEIDDLYMLRQVSFTFWRIYQDRTFQKLHRLNRKRWQVQRGDPGFEKDEKTVLRAKRWAFCDKCLEKRKTPSFKSDSFSNMKDLYCSTCKTNHTRMVFTHSQREEPPETRRCILSDADLRLCCHLTVSASSIWEEVANPGDKGNDTMPGDFGYPLERCGKCKALALALAEGLDYHSYGAIQPPTLSLERRPGVGEGAFRVCYAWRLPLFSMPKAGVITVPFLRQKLDEFEQAFGKLFCAHSNPHNDQILRALDPTYCHCLGGDSRVGNLVPFDREGWGGRKCDSLGRSEENDFIPSRLFQHVIACRGCNNIYHLDRTHNQIFISRLHSNNIELKDGKRIWRESLVTMMDPVLDEMKSDNETKHLFWCESTGCRNGKDWIEFSKGYV
ncbi:hypothetical protein RB213_007598 [Colletotrichum asianum]